MVGSPAVRYRPPSPSCPNSGRKSEFCGLARHNVSGAADLYDELIDHLTGSTPLSPGEASRVVADVLDYFAEQLPDFVRRRHAELKHQGLSNEQIFEALGAELTTRRFAPPPLSKRQLRRIVYG